jgi:biotin carboxyl carrier protein
MFKKFRINVEGRIYDVVVEELPADGIEAFPAVPAFPAAPAASAGVPPSPLAAAVQSPPGAGDEVAPLAGVVDSIDVAMGTTVTIGDKIAVIEAMKMKTDVFAKHGGTVTKIFVGVHDGVETGQVLLTIG